MKKVRKIGSLFFVFLCFCVWMSFGQIDSGKLGYSSSKGTVIKLTPEKFKDAIKVFNESGQQVYVYVNILYAGSDKKYKSETAAIKPYDKSDINFEYDDEWHDLVKDVRKYFKSKETIASAYEFEFHFKNDGMYLDKIKVADGNLEIYVKNKDFDF